MSAELGFWLVRTNLCCFREQNSGRKRQSIFHAYITCLFAQINGNLKDRDGDGAAARVQNVR